MGITDFSFHSWPTATMGHSANPPSYYIQLYAVSLYYYFNSHFTKSFRKKAVFNILCLHNLIPAGCSVTISCSPLVLESNSLGDAGVSALPFAHVNDMWQCRFPLDHPVQAVGAYLPISTPKNPFQTFGWCWGPKHACHFVFYQVVLTQHNEAEAPKANTNMVKPLKNRRLTTWERMLLRLVGVWAGLFLCATQDDWESSTKRIFLQLAP